MKEFEQMAAEMKEHLLGRLIPFWNGLKDEKNGGFCGSVSYDLSRDFTAEKGCILNSRITWFYANVYLLYRDGLLKAEDFAAHGYSADTVLEMAHHGYRFLTEHCIDRERGGIYWSLNADGTPLDTTKHTYNQAFCIYALSSYYDATGDREALKLARELMEIVETRCTDEIGYLEALTIDFAPESNEKLSENGVMADKTMNTLLHVFEAYSELCRVDRDDTVVSHLQRILGIFGDKVYNPALHRQEVFFDREYNTILDLHSYGHDIETAWLMDRGLDILGQEELTEKMRPITRDLTSQIFKVAFDGRSLADECDRGVVNEHRIWWVQAESVLGFANGFQRDPKHLEYLDAALAQWDFIKTCVVDDRAGSEWFWEVDAEGKPFPDRPIVEPWKCPYHNGRMCIEMIRRAAQA
ncbi:MAG: AGE family epimerase/isomerase [Lachnospiraceae bacterium]|nr:AGE family epimerase/isomerase [Lachnospiraceae bacterium]